MYERVPVASLSTGISMWRPALSLWRRSRLLQRVHLAGRRGDRRSEAPFVAWEPGNAEELLGLRRCCVDQRLQWRVGS